MDNDREKIKRILLFQLNKNMINFAKNNIISLEQMKVPRNMFEVTRKQIFDEAHSIIKELTEIIEQAF